ncbi:MAG: hypothetical protein HY874_02175 [Chloroflexi bacterium]|nr:hypothetical protein [Chloroflexota bacterium]
MTSPATSVRTPVARVRAPAQAARLLMAGAPLVALLGGIAAEWLDFRALRLPLLLIVGLGVLATSYAVSGTHTGVRPFLRTVAVGAVTWPAAETVYAVIHAAGGERFHAERFGSQWSQAIGLIAAHGLFLGTPTGIAAALMLHAPALVRRLRR